MPALRAVGQGLVGLLTVWAALWLATGDDLAPVRWGIYLAPFLAALALILMLASLLVGRRTAALAAASVSVLVAASSPASLTRIASGETDLGGLSLTSLSNRTRNRDMAATAGALAAHPADILVLQEISDPATLGRLLAEHTPDRRSHVCAAGHYMVVSRYRLGPSVALPDSLGIRCSLDLPGGRAQIYSVRLPRAVRGGAVQAQSLRVVLHDVAAQSEPVILAGDFNATPMTATLRGASEVLTNAFDTAGAGPGFTFPTPARRLGWLGPFLRIDHVLLDGVFLPTAARAARWYPPGADHFPVEIRFRDTRGVSG